MAGHSKFKNIQHRKGAQDKKKQRFLLNLLEKLLRLLNLGHDRQLTHALEIASLQLEVRTYLKRIDRALAQASDPTLGDGYTEEIRYEGFLPGGIRIFQTLTDNRTRTVSDIRSCFTKYGGNLGESGSVSFMFDHVGKIVYPVSVADGSNDGSSN